MIIHMSDLAKQDIIDLSTGCKIGKLCDFSVDSNTAIILNLIVVRKSRWFLIFGGGEEIIIPWCDVQMFGKDTILVKKCPQIYTKKKNNIFSEIISLFK